MAKAKKILLIRFSSIGDIVLTSPVLRCIKIQIPDCQLHVLTKLQNEQLFCNNPNVSKVHLLKNSLSEAVSELKQEGFDFIADLHCNLRSLRVRAALGVPSAGFPKLNFRKYLLVRFKWNLMPNVHVVDRYFEAVRPLGIVNDGLGLDFFSGNPEFPANAPQWSKQAYVAIAIGGQHNTKIFPSEKVTDVVNRLPFPVVLLGGQADQNRAESIKKNATNSNVWNACGKLSLMESAKVLESAAAVLTNDTGLMHIAAAYRKPIVSIWGSTVPALGMWPYMPGEEKKSMIIENKSISCRPCSKIGYSRCPKKHFDCMNSLSTALIASKITQLIHRYGS
jgi:heptosyltransferase-2